ncbi:MAG: hypothetical protein RLZZ21_2021 [Planctomycetota bacterium]|jgi:hypothetical protein
MTSSILDAPPPLDAAPASITVEPLRRLLATVRRRARGWIWVESLGWLAIATAAIFWTTLVLDWSIEPPGWVRLAMLSIGGSLLLWILATKLAGRLLTPLSDAALAVVVERGHPACRDSLSTAIELADRPRADVDPDLVRRTTADAVAMLDEIRPAALFRRRQLVMLALGGVAAVATVVGLVAVRPAVGSLWARRMLGLTDAAWPRRVQLEVEGFPGGVRTVARGTDVDVIAHVRADGGLPTVVELRTKTPDGWRTERMGSRGSADGDTGSFGHVVRGVVADTDLEVRGGDARLGGLRLRVVEPPDLADLRIDYQPPAYLGGGERQAASARLVRLPRGSRVRLTCTASKPLSAARLTLTPAGSSPAAPQTLAAFEADDASDRRVLAAEIDVLDADAGVELALVDSEGLANREPIRLVLTAAADAPPQVGLAIAGASLAVTPQARLPLEGTLSDDHGLTDAAVVIVRNADQDGVRLPIARVRDGLAVAEFPADAPEVVSLAPLGLKVGEKLKLTVEARDGCGLADGPNVGRSETWPLEVVTPEALRALLEAREIMLRRRFETVIGDLGQARDILASPPRDRAGDGDDGPTSPAANPAARCGEAAARSAGETGEIAAAFRGIRRELDINGVLTPELETRLSGQIAAPLERLAATDLPTVMRACQAAAAAGGQPPAPLVQQVDAVLASMRAVLDTMLELESFNELVERLRAVIRTQEEIRAATLEQQKKRGRQALEGP